MNALNDPLHVERARKHTAAAIKMLEDAMLCYTKEAAMPLEANHVNHPDYSGETAARAYAREHARLMDAAKIGTLSDELQEQACKIFDLTVTCLILGDRDSTLGAFFRNQVNVAIDAEAKRRAAK